MIWQHKDCPMCGLELQLTHSEDGDPIQTFRCPRKVELPLKEALKIHASYQHDSVASHFEVEYPNHKPWYMILRNWPFALNAYAGVFNIYKYDDRMNQRFISEIPSFDIPWKDMDKLIKKLRMYVTFS